MDYSDLLTLAAFVFFVGAAGLYIELTHLRLAVLTLGHQKPHADSPRGTQSMQPRASTGRETLGNDAGIALPRHTTETSDIEAANTSLINPISQQNNSSVHSLPKTDSSAAVQPPFRRRSRPLSSASGAYLVALDLVGAPPPGTCALTCISFFFSRKAEGGRRGHRSVASRSEMDLDILDMDDNDAPALLFVLSNNQARSKFNTFAANERSSENVKFLVAYRDIITFLEVGS